MHKKFFTYRSSTWAVAAALSLGACGENDGQSDDDDENGEGGKADDASDPLAAAVCLQRAVERNDVLQGLLANIPGALNDDGTAVIANYTAWPVYDPDASSAAMPADVTRRITDPNKARANLASRFGDCEQAVGDHLERARPNVYIYFTGFGGADQNNSLIGEGAILRWINERDPSALIFSINWNCAASSDPFCERNTSELAATDKDAHVQSMNRAIDVIVPQLAGAQVAKELKATIGQFGQQQRGYDSALSHSMSLAASLIDQILVADKGEDGESLIGDIRIAGYSMGAHAAAQLLVQDFTDGGGGFQWSTKACADGSNTCSVSGLTKVKWSLSMGLSGWSHALRTQNGLDDGTPRDPSDMAQFENGGLFRADAPEYAGKLAILNRRMDPAGNSDDTFERGFLDLFYGDYNHYSHDYDMPLFLDQGFVRALDAFLENPGTRGVKELGIVVDNASKLDFDGCKPNAECSAGAGYVAHFENRSHAKLDIPRVKVQATDGVDHPEEVIHAAAAMDPGSEPITLRTFDQEDLRGGVELYLRPRFDVSARGMHGLFSYGSCSGSTDELMPQAFIADGDLVMQMAYQGAQFEARVSAADAGLQDGQWTHLAFNWELPVESLTVQHDSASDLAAKLPGMIDDLQTHKLALALATGLRSPLATTYKRQKGQGTMTIFANGEVVAEAALGTAESARQCLPAADVLSAETYQVNDTTYPEFNPYARYQRKNGDVVALAPGQPIGTRCKAYRVRNTNVFFGCAQSEGVNAEADMDDIMLVWGPGRTEFDNINHNTGKPSIWPIGVKYGAARLRL